MGTVDTWTKSECAMGWGTRKSYLLIDLFRFGGNIFLTYKFYLNPFICYLQISPLWMPHTHTHTQQKSLTSVQIAMQQAISIVLPRDSFTVETLETSSCASWSLWTTHAGHKLLMGFQCEKLFSFVLYIIKVATAGHILDSSRDGWKSLSPALPQLYQTSLYQLHFMPWVIEEHPTGSAGPKRLLYWNRNSTCRIKSNLGHLE